MARRGSRTHHRHAIRKTETSKFEVWEADSQWPGKARGLGGPTWCGESYGYNSMSDFKDAEGEDPYAYSRRMTNCPGCSAAIGKALLAQQNGRVVLEKVEVPQGRYGSYYRTAWAIKIDGTLYGHAVMQNGWGNPWELKDLVGDDRTGNDFGRTVSHQPSTHYPAKPGDLWQTIHFASKEMMAIAALRCRERGESLFTVEERKEFGRQEAERRRADEAERAERSRQFAAERERKDGLRAERKATAIAGLEEIAKRADLSNIELAGLTAALDIINGKDVA